MDYTVVNEIPIKRHYLKNLVESLPQKNVKSFKKNVSVVCGWTAAVWYNKVSGVTKLTRFEKTFIDSIYFDLLEDAVSDLQKILKLKPKQ